MSLAQHTAQIKEWEAKYGKPKFGLRRFDPTQLKICCAKCGHVRKHMSRHHIANDFMFAVLLPDLYAARYILFHADDVRRLCSNDHIRIHEYYAPIVTRCYDDLRIRYRGIACAEWAEKWKQEFRVAFEQWLKTPVRKRKGKHNRKAQL